MINCFAANLKALRVENNYTQFQLAEKLQTTQRKISYWESGATEPDLDTLILIAGLFAVTTDDLIIGSD
jgi:transcriptional regulator with XRE-family HTH domain